MRLTRSRLVSPRILERAGRWTSGRCRSGRNSVGSVSGDP
ncbi:hypothetical protein SNL152K_3202 [Streptomyces sp. NL15-2K]|nr:hypothetical protein SNL152K_3202 [Streptomyces sp. NL15-2K]